ncbi:hypothetical protein DSL92_08615 [Billgrantia gudaonensis]|uniref:Uncharacterized protein n=1 Tax=Billgrantia gudaonensis TaxID=376427 RepID=A0A432JGA3_9GAMM|nr:hypothetical protein DSL92_08615 [Halomonas gudaonensis]
MARRFASETDVRAMGRTARGVRGMRLKNTAAEGDQPDHPQSQQIDAGADNAIGEESAVLETATAARSTSSPPARTVMASARGWRFPLRGRGDRGVTPCRPAKQRGALVAAMQVYSTDEMMLITDRGTLGAHPCRESRSLRATPGA